MISGGTGSFLARCQTGFSYVVLLPELLGKRGGHDNAALRGWGGEMSLSRLSSGRRDSYFKLSALWSTPVFQHFVFAQSLLEKPAIRRTSVKFGHCDEGKGFRLGKGFWEVVELLSVSLFDVFVEPRPLSAIHSSPKFARQKLCEALSNRYFEPSTCPVGLALKLLAIAHTNYALDENYLPLGTSVNTTKATNDNT